MIDNCLLAEEFVHKYSRRRCGEDHLRERRMVFTISCCTVLSLLLPAMHLGYGFLPVPRVDLPRSPPRDIARRPPVSFPARCATDPTTATRRWNCRSGLSRGFSRLAAAEEVGELSPRSCCAENRKSVLIRYARSRSDSVRRSGCRRSASCRTFVGARGTLPLMAQQDHLRRDFL
jgi:hypothetical protein